MKGKPGSGLGWAALRALGGVAAPLTFLLIVVAALSVFARNEGFLTAFNWSNITQSTAVVAILAVGETAVIILGHIDLSVGRMLALSGVVAAALMVDRGAGVLAGVLAACGTGLACGLVSGLLVTLGRMPSFIATLGMMGVAYGMALRLSGDQNLSGTAPGFETFSIGVLRAPVLGVSVPVPLVLMLATALAMHLLLSRTAMGRRVYAIGGNADAARLSGVSIPRTTLGVFALCGLLAGFAAVIHVSRTAGAQPTAGTGLELQAIAAAVIGGTSLSGGQGGVVGTLIGAFLMAVIQNGCDLKGVPPHWQFMLIGGVIWLAALHDSLRRRRAA